MCETPGYTARKAAGMDVRCANPECLVPIFTAPEIEEEEEVSETKPQNLGTFFASPQGIGVIVVLLIVTGLGVWYGFFRKPKIRDNPISQNPPNLVPPVVSKTGKTIERKTTDGKIAKKKQPKVEQEKPLEQLKDETLTAMTRLLGEPGIPDTIKPAAYELVAHAHARAGKLVEANQQLIPLANIARNYPYYGIRPLLELAWQQMAGEPLAGIPKAADFIREAQNAAQTLNRQGRLRQDTATFLAATLFATNEKEKATALIEKHATKTVTGQTSLAIITASESRSMNFHNALMNSLLITPEAYQHVAVTRLLCSRRKWAAARLWAESQTNPVIQNECLLAWIEQKADAIFASMKATKLTDEEQQAIRDQFSALEKIVQSGSPTLQISAYARIALHANDNKSAEIWLKRMRSTLKQISAPKIRQQPTVRDVFASESLSSQRVQMAYAKAIAAADVARAENRWNQTAGWESLSLSLNILRSLTASPIAIEELLSQAKGNQAVALQQKIATQFSLTDRGKILQKQKEYFAICRRLKSQAEARFRQQLKILQWAISWASPELLVQMGTEVASRLDSEQPVSFREPYLDTKTYDGFIPLRLYYKFEETKNTLKLAEFRQILSREMSENMNPRKVCLNQLYKALNAGKFEQAADAFNRSQAKLAWRRQQVMATASRLLSSDNLQAAFRFTSALSSRVDPYVKMMTFDLIAAQATASGAGREVVKLLSKEEGFHTADRIAFSHGFVVGLSAGIPFVEKTPQILSKASRERRTSYVPD
ncbi:MAG: hypothetical protein Tsb009_07100 [Planctomycetaceae bacterium]